MKLHQKPIVIKVKLKFILKNKFSAGFPIGDWEHVFVKSCIILISIRIFILSKKLDYLSY